MKKEKVIKGVAFLIAIVFVVILGISVTVIVRLHSMEVSLGRRQNNSTRAFYMAEAGLNKAIWYLMNTAPDDSTDGSWRTADYPAGSAPEESLSSGTYTGTYKIWVQDSGSDVSIHSRGTVGGITREITQSIVISAAPEAFDYALYVGGNINSAQSTNFTVVGGQEEGGTELPTPNLSYYQEEADTDQAISGNYTFIAGTYSGIWYVDGNVTINSNVTINGSVISTGNITVMGNTNVTISATSPYPALIANGKFDFKNSSNITVNGLVYVGADMEGNFLVQQATNINFTGTVIVAGNFNLQQSDTVIITYDESIVGNPPPGFVCITLQNDWKEI